MDEKVYQVQAEGTAVFVDAEAGVVMGMITFEIPLDTGDDALVAADWLRKRMGHVGRKFAGTIADELSKTG